ncbi:MAG: Z1 domain-containing protein [Verrucomicrobia bacterium]|nr:Z1 domain-containing protein [Verrucomicrobiota bacterium]
MSSLYEEVKKYVMLSLRDKECPHADQIRLNIDLIVDMMRKMGRSEDINKEALFRDILSLVNTWQAQPSVLRDRKHKSWLPERKAEIEWGFWKRYRQYLEEHKSWPSSITTKLDKITDEILNDIGNPAQSGQWDRRGMVVGEIQSGKTTNYTGLICKAVDAGYKLIIVLAGMTNDLRSQTQSRLDEEFLGFESEVDKVHSNGSRIGVGKILTSDKLIAHPLTYSSKDGDFRSKKCSNFQLGETPFLLVVKKNASVLKRILSWVQNQGKLNPATGKKINDEVPLLLIDDEADNASINTKSQDEDPTVINRAIRQILKSFQQSSYVGYTATPFANIFILPDEEVQSDFGNDIFPKGFIYHIAPPSNYIGPVQLFGLSENLDGSENTSDGLPLIRHVNDANGIFPPSHQKDLLVENLPDSLIEALQSFIITCAARRVRGQKEVHNSMLIHVTRFNQVQEKVSDLIDRELVSIRRIIEFNTGAHADYLFRQLEEIWEKNYLPTSQSVYKTFNDPQLIPVKWEEVRAELLPAIMKILVRRINGNGKGILDYGNHSKGLNVIAVGGDKLSRGLTLDGLSVSYYIRPARNYDTLLQMGRWFGYKPGYLDLCRLYTTPDLVGWYEHIAVANEELRREFNIMQLSKLTPEEYGLKVRTHPNGLNITAANKIRHGKRMQVSFSGHLAQTTVFYKDAKKNEANFKATEEWLQALPPPSSERKRVLWNNISPTQLYEFLENYTTHPMCRQAEGDLLIKYIQKMQEFGELTSWTVALISNSSSTAKTFSIAGHKIGIILRSDNAPDDNAVYKLKKANILSPDDEQLDLSKEQITKALEDTIVAWKNGETLSKKQPEKPSGPFIRNVRAPTNGLLLIYPLDPSQTDNICIATPIIGFAISFPKSRRGEEGAIEYQVNTKFWRDHHGVEDDDDL